MKTIESITPPEYSILITGYRSLRFLKDSLGSVLATKGPTFEVLFLDNGSPEAEAEWVEKNIQDPRLRVFKVEDTLYFAGGNNYVAERARGDFLVLLNSDTVTEPDWLMVLDGYLKKTGFELAQADIRGAHGDPFREPPGYVLDRMGLMLKKSHGDYVFPGKTFLICGAALAIRRDVFFELGRLDESFRMYWEDIDLSWRANLMGYRVGYVPGAIVYHVGGGTGRRSFFRWVHFRVIRNRAQSFAKNAGPGLLVSFLAINLAMRPFTILMNTLRGRFGKAVTEVAALGATLLVLGPALMARRKIQARRTVSDAELKAQGFIIRGFKYWDLQRVKNQLLGRFEK